MACLQSLPLIKYTEPLAIIRMFIYVNYSARLKYLIISLFCFIPRDTHQIDLPPFGRYATGIFFLDKLHHQDIEKKFGELAESLGLTVLCWRTVPTNNSTIGKIPQSYMYYFVGLLFLYARTLERKPFKIKQFICQAISCYICMIYVLTFIEIIVHNQNSTIHAWIWEEI